MKIILAILLIAMPTVAQTRSEFRQRYESPKVGIYVVRPGVIMSVKFGNESLWKDYACEAIIKPKSSLTPNADSSETMSAELVSEIIDEVVAVAQRGKLINELSVNGGCNGWRISIYENVTISRATRCTQQGGGTYQASIKWKAVWCKNNKN
jgi:hypothetical protein